MPNAPILESSVSFGNIPMAQLQTLTTDFSQLRLEGPLSTGSPLAGAADGSSVIPAATQPPGIELNTAIPIGALNGRWVTNNAVGDRGTANRDWWDIFQFRLDAISDLSGTLTGLTVDANVFLIRDWNNNNRIDLDDADEVLGGSVNPGIASEFFNANRLTPGTYYVLVGTTETFTNYTLGLTRDTAGSTFATARDLGSLSSIAATQTVQDFVGTADSADVYRVRLDSPSDLRLNLTDLSDDADIYLIQDANGNGIQDIGEVLARSILAGSNPDAIIANGLAAGTYFVQVVPGVLGASTNYRLSLSAVPIANTARLMGTLGADRFTIGSIPRQIVISGNGNADFGRGWLDQLDLSTIQSTSATINLTGVNSGGVAYNPGNGTRLFDAINLSDGRQILFEGLDTIRFADRVINLVEVPNDPLFTQQWNLSMMGVHTAWQFTTGSAQVAIAIEDSGLALNASGFRHGDLRPTLRSFVPGNIAEDFFRNVPGPNFGRQLLSHGTGVQGIIAAATNNNTGISGINWNSPVINIDVIDNNPGDLTLAAATQEIINRTVISQGQRLVINFSLSGSVTPEFEQLVARYQNQVLFVMASGNDDRSRLADPATLAQQYSNVIAVGASWGRTDADGVARTLGDRIAYPTATANHGMWGSNYGLGLTLMAPSEVFTTQATNSTGAVQFSYYDRLYDNPVLAGMLNRSDVFGGTSAAAPQVTGVASLVWSANPTLTAPQVQQILADTAYDLGTPGYDPVYGHGFVNADAAVRRAIALNPNRSAIV